MLDTLKFIIDITEEQKEIIESKSSIKTSYNNVSQITDYYIITHQIENSASNKISIRIRDNIYGYSQSRYVMLVECSPTKILNFHNIYGSNSIHKLTIPIRNIIQKHYGIKLISYLDWNIHKIDYTVSIKLPNQTDCYKYIETLKSLNHYRRYKIYQYDTSIMFVSSGKVIKIYIKRDEFLKNDYKKIKNRKYDTNKTLAQNHQDMSEDLRSKTNGIIRIEYSLKARKLKEMNIMKVKDVDINKIIKAQQVDIKNLYSVDNIFNYMPVSLNGDVRNRLEVAYGKRRASNLYGFWLECSSETLKAVRESTAKPTYNRKMLLLKKAGIQIGNVNIHDNLIYNIDLTRNYYYK